MLSTLACTALLEKNSALFLILCGAQRSRLERSRSFCGVRVEQVTRARAGNAPFSVMTLGPLTNFGPGSVGRSRTAAYYTNPG